ncbi:hypothetical protein JAAARDRAFT_211680 [Jaapia argillacea MUCL 33604]|uniref:Uncharacterized protein n=1 Tax=Jaapia argillacea MUCL 33604 TaxID=933084 RepID=A0A067P6J8_9AGAM|nr:hypothetical protein JAAARDRAFT_211680 [Jaapia argillacea MUCL 33604]
MVYILSTAPNPEVAIALPSMSLLELKRQVLWSIHLDGVWRDSGNIATHLVARTYPARFDLVGISLFPGGKWLIELRRQRLSLIELDRYKCVGSIVLAYPVYRHFLRQQFVVMLSDHEVGYVLSFYKGVLGEWSGGVLQIYCVDALSWDQGFDLILEIKLPREGILANVAVAGNLLAFEYDLRRGGDAKFLVVREVDSHKQAMMRWSHPARIRTLQILSECWLVVVDEDGAVLVDLSDVRMIPSTGDIDRDTRHVQFPHTVRICNDGWETPHLFAPAICAPRYLPQPVFLGSSALCIVDVLPHSPSMPTLFTHAAPYPSKALKVLQRSRKLGTRRSVACVISNVGVDPCLWFCAAPNGDDFGEWKAADLVVSEVDLAGLLSRGHIPESFAYDEASGRMCIVTNSNGMDGFVVLITIDGR